MYRQDSVDFLRDFSETLLRYNITLEQIRSGRFFIGDDEIILDSLRWDEHGFSCQVITGLTELFSARTSRPLPVYVFAGDSDKHRCVYCHSSLYRNFWGIRSRKCINPECRNRHGKVGFDVIPTAEVVK